jgi:hypothetical protein
VSELTFYFSAKKAIAQALRVDEAKEIRDKAIALKAYALQANDSDLIDKATEIRLRAERRCGELLREMAQNGERHPGGGDQRSEARSAVRTLADLGISNMQSSRWKKLADVREEYFEQKIEEAKKSARPARPRFNNADKPRRKEAAVKTSLDVVKVRDGAPIGDLRWSMLDRMIVENLREAALLRSIRPRAPADANERIRDFMCADEIDRLIAALPPELREASGHG